MKKTSFKRRQYFIKKDFQARFILKFIMIILLGGLISVGLTLANNRGTITAIYAHSKLTVQNTAIAIMPSVIFTTLAVALLLAVIVIVVTLLFSHKIAGPMYRFENDIQRIAKGDLKSRIHIRQGDQFQEVAVAMNDMIQALALRVEEIRNNSDADVQQRIDQQFKI